MPKIQPQAANFTTDTWNTSIEGVFAFSVENNGTALCEIAFDAAAPTWVPLHPGTAREFACIGHTPYQGRVLGRFPQEAAGTRLVSMVKSILICP